MKEVQLSMMFLWPIVFLVILGAWVGYFLYLLLWLIFAGGIAKILGVG